MAQGKKDPLEGMAVPKPSMFNRTSPTVVPLATLSPKKTESEQEGSSERIPTPPNPENNDIPKHLFDISLEGDEWDEILIQRNYRIYESQAKAIKWFWEQLIKKQRRKKISENEVVRYLLGQSLALVLEKLNGPEDLQEKIKKVNEEGIGI